MGIINSVLDNLNTIYQYHTGKIKCDAIDLNITGGCTYDCIFCECQQLHSKDDLTKDEILKLADEMAEEGISQIFIGGGEPLMRNDLWDIIQYFHSLKLEISTITNGSLPNKLGSEQLEIFDECVDSITVSIDSAIPEEYNRLRNNKKAYALGIETLKRLSALKKTKIIIAAVITKYNFRNLDQLIEFGNKFHVDSIQFQAFSDAPNYPELSVKSHKNQMLLSRREIDELKNVLAKSLELAQQIGVDTNIDRINDWIYDYYKNKESGKIFYSNMTNTFKCIGAFKRLLIRHNGDVQLCALLPKHDNIRNKSLRQILNENNPIKENLRKGRLHENCVKCFCGMDANLRFSIIASPIKNWKYLKPILMSKLPFNT